MSQAKISLRPFKSLAGQGPMPDLDAATVDPLYDGPASTQDSGQMFIVLPDGKPAATKLHEDGTFCLELRGPGAHLVTNSELFLAMIFNNLIPTTMIEESAEKMYWTNTDYVFERLITFTGTTQPLPGFLGSQFEVQAKTTPDGQEKTQVTVTSCSDKRKTVRVTWVPNTIGVADVHRLLAYRMNVLNCRRDAQDHGTFYLTTDAPDDKIPHYLYINGLIKTDTTLRTLKVSVRGRTQRC